MPPQITTTDDDRAAARPEAVPGPTPGLTVPRIFSTPGVSPYHQVEWVTRDALITDEKKGETVFEQRGVRVPAAWSQLATNVVASKYFWGQEGTTERESDVAGLIGRVAGTIADWGRADGYFATEADAEAFRDELAWLCLNQHGSFNSPVWFNVGVNPNTQGFCWDAAAGRVIPCAESPTPRYQGSACFIVGVGDDIPSIAERASIEMQIFKDGSGAGSDNSRLRSSRERIRGAGRASGPVSFMRIYDSVAAVTKSGGRCLAPHQPVFTAGGVKTVQELAESGRDFVCLSYDRPAGRIKAKTARAYRSGNKDVWVLRTDKGEFHLSADHPVMLKTGEFVAVADLKAGQSLMASGVHPYGKRGDYVNVGLLDGKKGKEQLHRLVARDVLGWDIEGRHVHHEDERPGNCDPSNLRLMEPVAHHALHTRKRVESGTHPFQVRSYPKAGTDNGMHRDSDFWKDEARVSSYARKQGEILKTSGRAATMQAGAARQKMLNVGYRLINAGHDITTFDGYYRARKVVIGKHGNSRAALLRKFERQFGGYPEFYAELRANNHRVIEARRLGPMDVYDVEVDDPTPDDGRPWDPHNFALVPVGQATPFGPCLYVHNSRRAAKMEILRCDHPDIAEFIACKGGEEAKARALIAGGYPADFNGEAYSSVLFQNSNLSVRATDAFLRAVEAGEDWQTLAVLTGTPHGTDGVRMPSYPARQLMDAIAVGTHRCGDPGLQYDDTIQRWNTVPNTDRIWATNPCSEFVHIDDTSCNLASVNLLRFRGDDGTFDTLRFRAACRTFLIAQEILVDHSSYPTAAIAERSHRFRPLGLGYANLGALLMSLGLPYDSDEGRSLAGAVTAIMHGQAYLTSAETAGVMGPFDGFAANLVPMLAVVRMHRDATSLIDLYAPKDWRFRPLVEEAYLLLNRAMMYGNRHGFRNSQVTLLAPTGTIAFMMDCDTTGVEPDIALVKYKNLAGGGQLKIVNRTVPAALQVLGYEDWKILQILDHIERYDTIEDVDKLGVASQSGLRPEHLPVFDCAFPPSRGRRTIPWKAHLKMMAAVQPFLSGAISKTVNMPRESTVEDIREAYLEGWRLGLKAVAIYRDGSKDSQPLNTSGGDPAEAELAASRLRPDRPGEARARELVATAARGEGDVVRLVADLLTQADEDARRAEEIGRRWAEAESRRPVRQRLPETRRGLTHKFEIQGHEGYLTVGLFPDGRPGEMFITMAKDGSTVAGLMDTIGTLASMGLQYGVPLAVLVEKFGHVRFEPSGITRNPDIPFAKSITDYVFRWMGMRFVPGYREANVPRRPDGPDPSAPDEDTPLTPPVMPPSPVAPCDAAPANPIAPARLQADAPACDNCGALTVRNGTCYRCYNCGNSMGCS